MRIYEAATETIASLFASLGHPLRLRIVRLLSMRPMCVSRLSLALDAPQATVSRNLALLRNAGLVEGVQHANFVRYELTAKLGEVSLRPLHRMVETLVVVEYDDEAVSAELRKRGVVMPTSMGAAESGCAVRANGRRKK